MSNQRECGCITDGEFVAKPCDKHGGRSLAAPMGSASGPQSTTEKLLAVRVTNMATMKSETVAEIIMERDTLRAALQRIHSFPVHSEPVGGAMAMQDIAHAALYPLKR